MPTLSSCSRNRWHGAERAPPVWSCQMCRNWQREGTVRRRCLPRTLGDGDVAPLGCVKSLGEVAVAWWRHLVRLRLTRDVASRDREVLLPRVD